MFDQADLELSSYALLECDWERREGGWKVLCRPSCLLRDPPFTQGEQFARAVLSVILSSLTQSPACLSVSISSSVSPNTTTS